MSRFPVVVEGQATRIHLCGRLIVELQGRRLEESLRGRQGRLLFAYLALNRDRPVRRDELAEALWNGKGAPPASDSQLAPPLSRLRKTLGPGVLEGRSELSLILPADAWVDWEVMRDAVRTARQAVAGGDDQTAWDNAHAALEIAQGGLLPGLEAPWIDNLRGELADLRVEALEAVAGAGARLGGAALPEAEQAARAAVQAQPFPGSARAPLEAGAPAVPGGAVPGVRARRADGGPARPRQRRGGAARLRGRARAPARGARHVARRGASGTARAAAAGRAGSPAGRG